LEKWKNFCGESEPLYRGEILSDITLNHFVESKYSDKDQMMTMANAYCFRNSMSKESNYHQIYEYYKIYFGYVQLNSDYDLTTVAWASSLLEENADLSNTERAFCLLYSNRIDDFWELLKNDSLEGTQLQQDYQAEVQRVRDMWDGHISFFSGAFIPQSNLNSVIGAKALFGFQIGAKVKKMQYDLDIAVRGGESKVPYEVEFENQLVTTTDHFSGYIGIDFAYELFNNYKQELDLEWGVGVDVMDVIEGDTNKGEDSKTLASYNFNLGLGHRFYLKNMNYIGLHGKYNLVNYKNKGGTDLGGNYFTVALSYNFFGNADKYTQLKRMKLK